MIASNSRSRALRFAGNAGLGQHLGVDLRLKGAEDVALAGEFAPEIGEAEIGGGGDIREADFAPALVFSQIERRAHGFGTLGKIVEHGGYSFTRKDKRFPWPSEGNRIVQTGSPCSDKPRLVNLLPRADSHQRIEHVCFVPGVDIPFDT